MKESGIGRENGLEAYEACKLCTGMIFREINVNPRCL